MSRQATLQTIADHVGVSRATVRQDVDARGRAAAETLHVAIEQARAGRPVVPEHVLLPTDPVVRGTTTPR